MLKPGPEALKKIMQQDDDVSRTQLSESSGLRALWQSSIKKNGSRLTDKFAIRFQKKSGNADICEDSNDDIYKTEVTSGDSKEMCADRVRLKDRILEGVLKAVKEVQAFSCEQGGELVAVKNDDRPLQKLVECLDHALLHGLRHITPGYWAVVKKFTHKDIILDISKLDRLATNLGRSRAWLYQALNDTALESYIRCFLENKTTTRKYYVEHALMRDRERLVLLQTLVSGLDFVTFDLQLNIAYFDLVSHIPRSASLDGDTEDQVSVHSCDDSSSVTSATSGAIADIDEISLASTPGDPSDKTIKPTWLSSPDGISETWTTQEKRHSSPQILSDADQIAVLQPSTEEIHSIGGLLKRSNSDIPIAYSQTQDEGKRAARPASLATASRIERLSNISPRGEEHREDVKQDDLVVIRLKGKKGKKGKKKKKGKSLSQGSTPVCGSGATLGLTLEEDSASLEFDEERRSKSSSFSSQGTSDKSSTLDLSAQSGANSDVQHGSNPSLLDAETDVNLEQSANDLKSIPSANSARNSPQANSSETGNESSSSLQHKQHTDSLDGNLFVSEADQQSAGKSDSDIGINQGAEVKSEAEKESLLANVIDKQASMLPQNIVQSNSPTTQPSEDLDQLHTKVSRLPKPSSLDYDTTIEYSLTSLDWVTEAKPLPTQLSQVQFEASLDDSVVSNLSMDDPGYTNLLLTNTAHATSTPVAEQSESDRSSSSGQEAALGQGSLAVLRPPAEEGSSNTPDESGGSTPIGERSSPEGIDSSKVIIGDECEADRKSITEVATEAMVEEESCKEGKTENLSGNTSAQGDEGIRSHSAEVIVDNNAKLYLMLEIFKNEHEEFKKLVRMSTGHTEGDLEPLFVLLTDQAIYLLRRGERIHRYLTETRIVYNDLDYISVAVNYQTIQLVCANRRNQYWLNTGDEQLSRFFLQELIIAMEGGSRTRNTPSILTDATTQLIALQKFAAKECRTENAKLHLYSLVHWEDLVDSATAADMQLYQPMIIKEGKLQFKTAGSFLIGSYWKDAYFMLRNNTFYRFAHRKDKEPELAVQLRTQHFGGCRRVRSGDRPSCFELILQDGTSLEIACKNEADVSNWLQAICRVVAQGVMLQHQGKTHSPCQPCCAVIAENKVLICHEDCQTNFYRSLASCDIADVISVAVDKQVEEYVILEFQLPDNPWVIYFNCVQEKDKFLRTISAIWKQHFQVDLPIHDIEDNKVQKRCRECLTLIQSSWQRCDSITRGRIGGNIW